jgi:hypothetical protein
VRRWLLPKLPLFSRIYHLGPEEVERLSMREVSEYLIDLQRLQAEG